MCNRSETELDVEPFAELMKLSGGEVASVISDDAVRHAEAAGDAFEELDSYGSRLVCDWYSFYPLGELVDCNQQEGVTSWRRFR